MATVIEPHDVERAIAHRLDARGGSVQDNLRSDGTCRTTLAMIS